MNLQLNATQTALIKAHEQANSVLQNEHFWNAIKSKARFDMTEVSPSEIADILRNTNHAISVRSWKPSWWESKTRYRKTLAITGSKDLIRINSRKLGRPIEHIAGTLIHEGIHAIDHTTDRTFGHGDNSSVNKDETAPYWIGNLAIAILNGSFKPDVSPANILQGEE